MSRVSPKVGAMLGLWLWEPCCHHQQLRRTGVISQHHLYVKWEVFEGKQAEGILLNTPSVLQIAPESCSQVQLSSPCCWSRLHMHYACCPYHLGNVRWMGRAQPWVSGPWSAWSMVQSPDFSCQSKSTAWSSSSHSLCLIPAQIPGLQGGGTP